MYTVPLGIEEIGWLGGRKASAYWAPSVWPTCPGCSKEGAVPEGASNELCVNEASKLANSMLKSVALFKGSMVVACSTPSPPKLPPMSGAFEY